MILLNIFVRICLVLPAFQLKHTLWPSFLLFEILVAELVTG